MRFRAVLQRVNLGRTDFQGLSRPYDLGARDELASGSRRQANRIVYVGDCARAGFAGNVSFTCTGAPAVATCNAPSITLKGGSSVSYAVSISTTGASAGGIGWTPRLPRLFLFPIASLLAFCTLLFFIVFRRGCHGFARTKFIAACAAAILLVVIGIAGCGGGSAASPQGIPTAQHSVTSTPQGTFNILLTPAATTASGTPLAPMSPIPLTLIVQ